VSKSKPMSLTVMSILLAISLAINVSQIRRIIVLQTGLEKHSVQGTLPLGSQVPSEFSARDLDGRMVTIRFTTSPVPTVLYVFRPSCVWCRRNSESIKALAQGTAGRYKLIGLSLAKTGLTEFVKEHDFQFPVYSDVPPAFTETLKLRVTPETLVISPSGSVLENWTGAYTGILKSLTENFFSIHLPDFPPLAEQM
jgi:peroxiredoxin